MLKESQKNIDQIITQTISMTLIIFRLLYISKLASLPTDWLVMDKQTYSCVSISKSVSKLKKWLWLSKIIDKQANRLSNTDSLNSKLVSSFSIILSSFHCVVIAP